MNIQDVEDKLDSLSEEETNLLYTAIEEAESTFKKKCTLAALAERANLTIDAFCSLPHFKDLVKIMETEIQAEALAKFKEIFGKHLTGEELDVFVEELTRQRNQGLI